MSGPPPGYGEKVRFRCLWNWKKETLIDIGKEQPQDLREPAERSEVEIRCCHGCSGVNDEYNTLKEIWKLKAWSTLAFKELVLVYTLQYMHFQAVSLKPCMHRNTCRGSLSAGELSIQ